MQLSAGPATVAHPPEKQPPRQQIEFLGFNYYVKYPAHLRGYLELEPAPEPTPLSFRLLAALSAVTKEENQDQDQPEEPEKTDAENNTYLARRKLRKATTGMAEPRVRLARHQGQLNFGNELRHLLHAYGDPTPHPSHPQEPLPETLRVLDEIVTDFIIETCHSAAQCATYSRRQKIKVDDFRFALRRDPTKLGRVQELFRIERELKEARRAFDQNDDRVGASGKKGLEELAGSVAGGREREREGEGSVVGAGAGEKGKGKAVKRGADSGSEGGGGKKRKSGGGSVV
ncbi:Transcription initiation factor TFIID subunit 13 [Emmonsiellopsis sp. PD_33]|nr:Transcription initiation factor TFIID subunit 13 [Emmonsiellopsis sp. PD_33]